MRTSYSDMHGPEIPGFAGGSVLLAHRGIIWHRASREGRDFLLKTANLSSAESSSLLQREFNLLRRNAIAGIPKPLEFLRMGHQATIVFDGEAGEVLSRVLAREKAMEILRLLDVAVAIVEVVQSFHANGITHRSLTEERILLHADGRVVVLDFHNATTFVQERAPALMAAADMDMHYLAPEQTGRTNLLVDFRADLYALGALFYKMLTGRLPFASADSLELVHAQLASMPAPPSELVGSIPKVMGDIVMKLLAKSPDDRYQSAEGLLYDLNQCRAALRTEGVIPDFVIGGRDFSSTLHLPDDLFGREDQKQTLQRLVRSAVSGQSSIALVMGEPGIGKSALVASCLTDVFSARGVVLNGRFDSLGRDRPYHGIRQAIQSVVNQMMGESEELLSETRTRLVADVAEYASVLVSAFQELSEILQSEGSGNMSGAEFDRQLEEGFVRLLTSLAGGGPVVLALDDVQWADHASRRLISRMLSRRNMGSLLCLLSVREQEIDPLHPVLQIMKEQDNEHTVVIRLGPLSEEDIFEILTRTLRTDGAPVRQLATLLRAKTEGNPFFLRQYLRDLGNDGTLKAIDGRWVWDYSAIQARSIADNVIDLVVTKILYEKGEAQSLLKLISCLGSRAPVDLLAISTGRTSADLESILEPLVRNGFLVLEGRNVSFVHDRVREAAHTLMTDDERSSNHLVLGRALLRDHTIIGDAEYTIPAVLNPVMHLLNPAERLELARLNLAAGSRARSGGAFSEAGRYFSQGYSLIEDANWDTDYELSFALALGLAESSYLNEEHAKAVDLFQVCSGRARDPLDSARVQELRALLLLSEGKLTEAIDAGLTGLDTLGIRLPRHPGQMGPLSDLIACRLWFVRRKIEDLSHLKDASDSRIQAAMHLMMIIGNAAFIGRPALVPVVIARMVRLSLRYGFFEETTFAIVMFGLIIYALGDPSSAIRFGATGAAMLSRVKSKEITGKVLYIQACFIRHLSEHGGKSIEAFLEGYSYSVTAGDTQFQSYNANHYCIQHLLYGGHFGEALEQFSRFTTLLEQAGNLDPIQYHKAFKQFAKFLTNSGQNISTSLEGADFDVAAAERKLKESGSFTVLFPIYMLQGVLELLSGNYGGAIERFTEMRKFESGALGMPFVPHSCMFEALAALDYASRHSADRDALIRRARKLLKRLKTWSKLGPENYLHKALLVEGAIAEARDEIHPAFELYDHAIERSLEGGFVFEAALASERAGKMYRRIGRERLSRIYASSAYDLFQRCGATYCADRLRDEWPGVDDVLVGTRSADTSLDFASVMKAARAISEEIRFDTLLEKLLSIMMENAGASRGAIVIEDRGHLTVEVVMDAGQTTNQVTQSTALASAKALPLRVVYFVQRTRRSVILENAYRNSEYGSEPYIASHHVRSLACLPIVNRGKLQGIIYLENRHTAGTFTSERLEILGFLTGQAAISIENAIVYRDLEAKVSERTAMLNEKKSELEKSLSVVEKLKSEQDCDYYLTSLLLEPLAASRVDTGEIRIDFYLEQKKKFRYRRWESSLGGDICSAHTIELRGARYSVFVNADAMGKSIQGAGGALVLGAVFASLIQRTKLTRQIQEQYPEQWLTFSFVELQKVFESFEGYMMISMVLGIVNNRTGAAYFINAEHPDLVLLRHGQATFLQPVATYAKIGRRIGGRGENWSVLRDDVPLSVTCFQLQPGDMLFAGSDGRDDIGLGLDDAGNTIVSENPDLFLRKVEESEGSLERLQGSLHEAGEILDDLSLLKIEYLGHGLAGDLGTEIERELSKKIRGATTLEALRSVLLWFNDAALDREPSLVGLFAKYRMEMRLGLTDAAIDSLQRYVERNHLDTRLMLVLAKLQARADGATALATLDRLRLRNPLNNRFTRRYIHTLNMVGGYEEELKTAINDWRKRVGKGRREQKLLADVSGPRMTRG